MWYVQVVEYYSAMKMSEILVPQMSLEDAVTHSRHRNMKTACSHSGGKSYKAALIVENGIEKQNRTGQDRIGQDRGCKA